MLITPKHIPIVERDAWLEPVEGELIHRHELYINQIFQIERAAGSIVDYANGYRYYGWQRDEILSGWWFREWLPAAKEVYLFGDFNDWRRGELELDRKSVV